MFKCIIIDDEESSISVLSSFIAKTPQLELVYSTTNPIEGLHYINQAEVQLIFLDIHMDDLTGMQLIKLAKTDAKFILTTAYSEYAIDAFEEGVLDYLLKPISYERFLKAIQKLNISSANTPIVPPNSIFVKVENKGKLVQILVDEILFVESMGNYLIIHTPHSKTTTLLAFKDLEKSLPEPKFLRVHKSYLVAINKISGIDGNEIFINKTIKIPIGRSHRELIFSVISKFIQ